MITNGHGGRITNQQFADTDPEFRQACIAAGVAPTKRRAAKWRLGRGYVFGFRQGGPSLPDAAPFDDVLTAAAK